VLPVLYNKLAHYLQSFLHLFYPHICLECGTDVLLSHNVLCNDCEKNLPYTDLFKIENNLVEKIFWGRCKLSAAGAGLFFTKESVVQTLLFEIKYKQNKKAGWLLGRIIGTSIQGLDRFKNMDLLIPIPLTPKKLRQRGLNQSMIICEGILQVLPHLKIAAILKKIKNTSSQTNKDRIQRGEQMQSLFELENANEISGAHLLLIDDVLTTGATLEAACTCLWQAQPHSISIAAAAYTL
jgi:ComF family protein